ncbi:hypothetical protein [Caedibacter taeniospiralis]|uniref:hypothetical protein n=1 Tax=Caedibacter taeniospiralis TaxID=28907 RepID=UPI001302BE1F|nr:hypothetical protein [Caedibacter taeniospiralis]
MYSQLQTVKAFTDLCVNQRTIDRQLNDALRVGWSSRRRIHARKQTGWVLADAPSAYPSYELCYPPDIMCKSFRME